MNLLKSNKFYKKLLLGFLGVFVVALNFVSVTKALDNLSRGNFISFLTPKSAYAAPTCIVTLFGKQYDVESLRSTHTGGDVFVCGTDITATYQARHGTNVSMMQPYLVVAPTATPIPTATPTPLPTVTPVTPTPTSIPSIPTPTSVPGDEPVITPLPTVVPTVAPQDPQGSVYDHDRREDEEEEDYDRREDGDHEDYDNDEKDWGGREIRNKYFLNKFRKVSIKFGERDDR